MELTSFIVKRSNWSRGQSLSCLLKYSGKMCCLGFAAKACGYADEHLIERGSPQDVIYNNSNYIALNKNLFPESFMQYDRYKPYKISNSSTIFEIMNINDNQNISDDDREIKLKELFLTKLNIEIIFED